MKGLFEPQLVFLEHLIIQKHSKCSKQRMSSFCVTCFWRESPPTSRSQWGKFHCQHTLNTVLTDITNLISLRDGLVAGLKLVAQ